MHREIALILEEKALQQMKSLEGRELGNLFYFIMIRAFTLKFCFASCIQHFHNQILQTENSTEEVNGLQRIVQCFANAAQYYNKVS